MKGLYADAGCCILGKEQEVTRERVSKTDMQDVLVSYCSCNKLPQT